MYPDRNELTIKDNTYSRFIMAHSVAIAIFGVFVYLAYTYAPQSRNGASLERNLTLISLAILGIITIGFLNDRRPLVITEKAIFLPLKRFQLREKREIPITEISRLFIDKFWPRYNSIDEYINKKEGEDAVWMKTKSGKTYFLAYKEYRSQIYSKLRDALGDEFRNIDIDKGMLK